MKNEIQILYLVIAFLFFQSTASNKLLKSIIVDGKINLDWSGAFGKKARSPNIENGIKLSDIDFSKPISVPKKGIVDYIGKEIKHGGGPLKSIISEQSYLNLYKSPTPSDLLRTRFNLWRQLPWKKISGKAILRIKVSGALPLEATPTSSFPFGGPKDFEPIESLNDFITLFNYAAYDPRVTGVFINLGRLSCGYAKLQELRRTMTLFRQSGKKIICFAEAVAEKELYFSLFCDQFFVPPDGSLDIRGFSAGATFVRGVLDKVGVEPQVQRIGKYKSAGDSLNRTDIAEAQREVISSLLSETSGHWIRTVAAEKNKSVSEVELLWAEAGSKSPSDFRDRGYISGVRYLDQVEALAKEVCQDSQLEKEPGLLFSVARSISRAVGDFCRLSTSSSNSSASSSSPQAAELSATTAAVSSLEEADRVDFDLDREFRLQPRRSFQHSVAAKKFNSTSKKGRRGPGFLPGGLYLRKMRKGSRILSGLRLREATAGPRIAVINAVGAINSGPSSNGGIQGRSLGSDSLVALIRQAEKDPGIIGVVLRVDSPGGSALASDVMWRALRRLSREKPVVASMVDVAASGGYYLSMACDQIIAEELTITGSIGVVTAKFNSQKLNEKIGFKEETLSIGRYAELLSTSRSFTPDEQRQFESFGQQAYRSFVSKAAASRDMPYAQMQEVAQGRVWTGRQAMERGLVDGKGGLFTALELVNRLVKADSGKYRFNYDLNSLRSSNYSTFFGAIESSQDALWTAYGFQVSVLAIDTDSSAALLRCLGPEVNRRKAEQTLREALDKESVVKTLLFEGDEVYRVQTLSEPRRGLGIPFLRAAAATPASVTPLLQEKVMAICDEQALCDLGLVSSEALGQASLFVQGEALLGTLLENPALREVKGVLPTVLQAWLDAFLNQL